MANVFEIHTEECRAAMAAQNEAIKTAQKTFLDAVETTRTLEDKTTLAARSEADAAIGKARAAYDDALEAAQKTYGETLDQSRGRAWDTIQKRLSIWNGELPEDLPPASTLESSAEDGSSLAAFEHDPTGGAA